MIWHNSYWFEKQNDDVPLPRLFTISNGRIVIPRPFPLPATRQLVSKLLSCHAAKGHRVVFLLSIRQQKSALRSQLGSVWVGLSVCLLMTCQGADKAAFRCMLALTWPVPSASTIWYTCFGPWTPIPVAKGPHSVLSLLSRPLREPNLHRRTKSLSVSCSKSLLKNYCVNVWQHGGSMITSDPSPVWSGRDPAHLIRVDQQDGTIQGA